MFKDICIAVVKITVWTLVIMAVVAYCLYEVGAALVDAMNWRYHYRRVVVTHYPNLRAKAQQFTTSVAVYLSVFDFMKGGWK